MRKRRERARLVKQDHGIKLESKNHGRKRWKYKINRKEWGQVSERQDSNVRVGASRVRE